MVINAGRYNDPKPSPRTILRREKLAREQYRAKKLERLASHPVVATPSP
jgi:hypothetical protein